MPDLQAQFKGEVNIMARRLYDLDSANIILAHDMGRISRGEVHANDVIKFAENSLRAAYEVIGPR